MFRCEIQNDHKAIKQQEERYQDIYSSTKVTQQDIGENYLKIKYDVVRIIQSRLHKEYAKTVKSAKRKPSLRKSSATSQTTKAQEKAVSM
jgi:hypothetical protein